MKSLVLSLVAINLAVCPLLAQNALYVDLSGEWRVKIADDPAFGRPDFDDRAWDEIHTRELPAASNASTRWMRRAFILPATTHTGDLVLTIGGFSPKYEVYLNGLRIGGVSADPNAPLYYPRARLFPVPPGLAQAGARNVVALRELPRLTAIGLFVPLPGAGPYLLTSGLNAPVGAPAADREERLRRGTPLAVVVVLDALFTLFLLLLWIGERDQTPLLLLAFAPGKRICNQVSRVRVGLWRFLFAGGLHDPGAGRKSVCTHADCAASLRNPFARVFSLRVYGNSNRLFIDGRVAPLFGLRNRGRNMVADSKVE
jgi:hypothetical protein